MVGMGFVWQKGVLGCAASSELHYLVISEDAKATDEVGAFQHYYGTKPYRESSLVK
jgi:hypothetical protein